MTCITRFAPTPSGELHLGNLFSALFAQRIAVQLKGKLLLRIDDLDDNRSKPKFEPIILDDLKLLGISWDDDPIHQSTRFDKYEANLKKLEKNGFIYHCFCTRKERRAFLSAPHGDIKAQCPNNCAKLPAKKLAKLRESEAGITLRLNAEKAGEKYGYLTFTDMIHGQREFHAGSIGDIVLGNRDLPISYHIACVTDDSTSGVNVVTRGDDLLDTTMSHRVLQMLLNLPEPVYSHHPLLLDDTGRRLAKRNASESLTNMLDSGRTVEDILDGFNLWFDRIVFQNNTTSHIHNF